MCQLSTFLFLPLSRFLHLLSASFSPPKIELCWPREAEMEEESTARLTELSIQTLRLLSRSIHLLSTVSNHPLFATLAAVTLLVALYLPRALMPFLLSPVPISTFLILAALLRLGSPSPEFPAVADAAGSPEDKQDEISSLCLEPNTQTKVKSRGRQQKVPFCDCFIECGRRSGPLEVIYEEEELEECGSPGSQERLRWDAEVGVGRLQPIGFTLSDSDSESDVGFPTTPEEEGGSSWLEELLLRWENEEDMIEIELETEEEDNLIEIDISGGR